MKRSFVVLVAALAAVGLAVVPASAAESVFAHWTADNGTISINGAATVADAVAADDGAFVQLDDNAWVSFAFPDGWDAVPDGTPAADITVHVYDALYPADATVDLTVVLDGTVTAGTFFDTADVPIDLDALGTGPVHEVKVTQGPTQDPAYPHLGFDLNAVSGYVAPRHVTGTWAQYPEEGASFYEAQIRPPINANGGSNWPARSKGGIPVMFDLLQGTGPAAFESILSDLDGANDYSFASFTPDSELLFKDLAVLEAVYDFTTGDCHGGALRWSVRVSPTESIFIYYGAHPNFTSCEGVDDQSGVNLLTLTDARFDTSQLAGGTFYDTYAHALQLAGTRPVIRASLVLDGGWAGDQRATVGDVTVNDSIYQWADGGAALAPTCTLPDAQIEVVKTDPTPNGSINEETVQASLADTGNLFRVIDCKYQYVLSIPSLDGAGTYSVGVEIEGSVIDQEATFDLK